MGGQVGEEAETAEAKEVGGQVPADPVGAAMVVRPQQGQEAQGAVKAVGGQVPADPEGAESAEGKEAENAEGREYGRRLAERAREYGRRRRRRTETMGGRLFLILKKTVL